MPRFYRVMAKSEWAQVQATNMISPSLGAWGDHKAGTVFFVFQDSVKMKHIDECATERTPAVLVAFELSDVSKFEADRSGWSDLGALAYRGPLREDETRHGFRLVCRFE